MRIQRLLIYFSIFLFLCSGQSIYSTTNKHGGIEWLTSYTKAMNMAKASSKPVVLFFTGSDWCGWCNKLEKEALETPAFSKAINDKLIFVKLDFPMHTKPDSATHQQNEQLQKKFSVRSFPTIVLVDPDQQLIGITGYRAGGGKQYATHLMKMVNEYAAYKQQMHRLGSHKFSGKELKRLYQKAQELSLENDANLLIRIGMNSDQAHFFLAERYRFLVNTGQFNKEETNILKQQLLDSDPKNKYLTHYQVAVIDFEACCEEMEKRDLPPEMAIAPLLHYISAFGEKDQENLWRLNMVISQVYLDKDQLKQALEYAKNSYFAAPTSIQPDIAMAIRNIQAQLKTAN